jgi:hypothetical protein
MDFSNRNPQPAAPAQPAARGPAPGHNKTMSKDKRDMWNRVGIVGALLAVVILLIGLVALVYSSNNDTRDTESKYINTTKLQAVFLNTGQVYFGNIQTLNNNFVVLTNIFYLQTNSSSGSSSSSSTSSSSSNNVTLVKLGCELHMPYDQMVINRSQVTFWENLQSNGQVAKAVATFQKENPNGQKCTDQSSSSSTTSGSSVQSAGSSAH